jgi:hypothetical protein
MVRRVAGAVRQLIKRWRSLGPVYQFKRPLERHRLATDLVGAAAQTGAKAGRGRLGAGGEEADILPLGMARRAGRPAIDARGEDPGDE